MTQPAAPAPALPAARVFISCPGDLRDQRRVVEDALAALNADPEFAGRVELVPYAYENVVPARVGMDAQDVVNSYMLRPDDCELFICMFWRRMGTPLAHFVDPTTNRPYQSGTEYEFLTAYAAQQRSQTPVVLLYRRDYPAPAPSADEDPRAAEERQLQLARVDSFFARFAPGGDLQGLVGKFTDDADLARVIQRDVASALRANLLPLLARRVEARGGAGPVSFGLPPLPAGFVARPEALRELRLALLGSRPAVGVVAATAVQGIGGLGKTVLARAAWEDPAVRAAFPDGILWATLGEHPEPADIARIQRDWVYHLGGDVIAVTSPESGRSELARLLADRAVLLVLDDVWRAKDAEPLEVAAPRVRVLITTRDAAQAEGMSLVQLELMREDEARALLRAAARGRVTDDATLDAIADRLGHLPLALQVVGALLARGIPWLAIEREMAEGRLPEIETAQQSIFAALATSVHYLPAADQARYRELVIFPRDEPLAEGAVLRLWGRTGGLSPFAAQQLLAELRDRSLIQPGDTLHDLQVDYLAAVVPPDERRRLHAALCDAYGDPATWPTALEEDDDYAWRRLAWHLSQARRERELETLLTDGTYLQRKLARLGTAAVVADLALCPAVEDIQRLSYAIRAGALVLAQDAGELANQIQGRVGAVAALHDLPPRRPPYFQLRTQSLKADPAFVRTLEGHTAAVEGCAFSPDGRLALSASDDATLRLWDVATGASLRTLAGHTAAVRGCAFSPDGRLALSASDDATLRLWDVATGASLRTLAGHTGGVEGCAFSPDGRLALSASADATLRLWDVATGASLRTLAGHTGGVWGCAFSPDGRLALSASGDRTLRLWDVATGASLRTLAGHTGWGVGLRVQPGWAPGPLRLRRRHAAALGRGDGGEPAHARGPHRLGVGLRVQPGWAAGPLRLRRPHAAALGRGEGASLRTLAGHTGGVWGCAFSPDGAWPSLPRGDRTLRLWDVATGASLRTLGGHTGGVWGCAFSPDGRLALSASGDRTLRLWDVARGRACARSRAIPARCGAARSARMGAWPSPPPTTPRCGSGTWRRGRACARSRATPARCRAARSARMGAWPSPPRATARCGSGTWRAGEPAHARGPHRRGAGLRVQPGWAPGPLRLRRPTLRLWDVATGASLRTLAGHTAAVLGCAFSPDGRLALSASADATLRLWDVATGASLRTLAGHTDWVRGCAFSPDGRLALSASADATLRLWDVASGQSQARWLDEAAAYCCAYGPDGHQVLAGDSLGGVPFPRAGVGGANPSAPFTYGRPRSALQPRRPGLRGI